MEFEGCVLKEQGQVFGIVIVRAEVLNNSFEASKMRQFGVQAFGNIPIVLMAQNYRGTSTYLGRRDIVDFLASISMSKIPWKRYTLN